MLGKFFACFVDLTAKDDLESYVNGLLHASPFGTVLQQAVTALGTCHHLIDRYIHDYTQMLYTPHSKLPDEELKVFHMYMSASYSCQSDTLAYVLCGYVALSIFSRILLELH